MNSRLGLAVAAFAIVLGTSALAHAADGTAAACPAGQPASPRPAADWVPTADCLGWVPPSHPLAGSGGTTGTGGAPTAACSVATLRGSYVFSAAGFNIVAGVQQPKAIVEPIDFNGDGTLFVPAATLSVNGVISRSLPSFGTYTVGEDCTGTIVFNGPTYDIFLSVEADRISMIQTNPNTVFQGVATRRSK